MENFSVEFDRGNFVERVPEREERCPEFLEFVNFTAYHLYMFKINNF